MILLRKLAFARAGKPLVTDASLQFHPGWKIGLTGANGCGKSSFFALLRGELHAEAGDLDVPPGWRIGHVAQDTPALPTPALDFVIDGDSELRAVETALAQAEAAHDGHQIAELHTRLQDIGGYTAKARAAEILDGLGFTQADHRRAIADFSGGWRVRLNLARALVARADLLLLDEPTNHLDLDAVLWLESWLKSFPGTLLMISHDRDFLDAVVGQILHIEAGQMKLYGGNYSTFERTRAERLALQQAMHVKQQREVAHLHAYIDRFRAKASKARQAQSRIKALERMELISAAHVDTPFAFAFREPEGVSDPLLQIEDAKVGYGETVILSSIQLTLRPGSRIGLLGRNGAGKSTLVKLLSAEIKPQAGKRLEGRHLKIGYFAQHQMELLRPDESPLQHITRQEPQTREQELRDYLGGFDFRGPMADAPCGRFSGGEKARLALALMIRTRPNLLLLDEPTNHLDLEMREALTLALQETEAAVVLVSHDRHLLRTTVDELWLVADGQARVFDGDLDDYADWLAQRRTATRQVAVEKPAQRQQDRAAKKLAQAEQRKLVKEAEKLEQQIAAWQVEKSALAGRLSDPALYADHTAAAQLAAQDVDLTASIEAAETRWLVVHEALEALERQAAE
ncbi:MAG: ATP-binding cassette domain-containing protein [Rhodocyclaceae bacterium]|nr:ATP-binding cassette domain-containing protein [Rhodocyclaceae bacterium]MDZ4216057.1 ATP-binding cassette domain-containing protein [Rhodocyclaceae bacterium]